MKKFIIHKILIEVDQDENYDILDEDELIDQEFANYEQAKLEYDKMKY